MSNTETLFVEFENNHHLSTLVGPQDTYLLHMEKRLGVTLALRGNRIAIMGHEPEIHYAHDVLYHLYAIILKGRDIELEDIDEAIRMATVPVKLPESTSYAEVSISTKRRMIFPRTPMQAHYVHTLQTHDLSFGIGPAGTGKTYLAVALGVSLLLSGKVDRIILSRPAVEAGEHLGFLPGDMKEKVDPYLRPLYDALHDMMPSEQVMKRLMNGEIEVAPLAFMRGRTLENAFIILDEAQNTTSVQMKMFLTRLGPNSRMVVTGDLTQIDLTGGTISGLKDATRVLKDIESIGFTYFTEADVIRHKLVSKIIQAYAQDDAHCKDNSSIL